MNITEKTITLKASLYARVAMEINRVANQLSSRIYIEKDRRSANLKSLLGILSLGCHSGETIKISCIHNSLEQSQKDFNIIEQAFNETGDRYDM